MKHFNYYAFLLIAVFSILFSTNSSAQINKDSLWAVWKNTNIDDTLRLDAIYNIAWDGYLFNDPDSAKYYAQMQYEFADSTGLEKWQANALYTLGVAHYLKGEFADALQNFNKCLSIREKINDEKGIAVVLNGIGLVHSDQGNTSQAIINYTKTIKILEKLGDKSRISGCYNNIGIIYQTIRDNEKALEYYQKSLEINEELDDKESIANSLNNIGIIQKDQEKYESALESYQKSIAIGETIGYKRGISNSLINIGNVYTLQGDFEKSLDYFRQSLKIKEELEDKKGIAMSLVSIGNALKEQKNYSEAISYSKQGLALSKELNAAEEMKEAANILYECYKALGQTQKSLEMHELYVKTKDELTSEENHREVLRQEFQYNYEKQYLIDSLNFARNEAIKNIKLKKSENAKWFFLILSALTLLLAGFVYYAYKQKQKANILLEERNKFEIENKKRAISLFGQQVSKEIALELLSESFNSGSKKLFACIMFLDIRDFTTFAETKEPAEIIQYQNDVFGFMIDVISKHHGIINQFLGDGFMATFGAPSSSGNDIQNAVNAAKEILEILNNKCNSGEIPQTKIGIGLHAGNIVTGNVGTVERKQYSITGNTVILASRIEQLNKEFNSEILISKEVMDHLDQHNIKFKNLGSVTLKGRVEPMEIIRLL